MSTLALAGRPPCDASVMMENVTVVREMIEASWQPLLAAFQQVLLTVRATGPLETVITAYGILTRACAVLQLVGPRDKALAPLCRTCLPGAGGVGVGVGDGGAPPVASLLPHNVIMVKALLLLTFEMGGALGESWVMVLEVLQRLDAALIDRGLLPNGGPNTPQARRVGLFPPPAEAGEPLLPWSQTRVDLEIGQMRVLLDKLFEESDRLDDDTAATLLQALCRVSVSAVTDARPDIVGTGAAPTKSDRMFGVDKVVVVMLNNLHRLGRLLDVAMQQLSRVALHSRATVRKYGMACITRLIVAALARHAKRRAVPAGGNEQEGAGAGGGAAGSPRTPGGFARDQEEDFDLERRLLAVYEELYRCPYSDTKNYVLEGLYEVLQSHGEEVGPAWPIVLALIKGVAQDEEEHHVRQVRVRRCWRVCLCSLCFPAVACVFHVHETLTYHTKRQHIYTHIHTHTLSLSLSLALSLSLTHTHRHSCACNWCATTCSQSSQWTACSSSSPPSAHTGARAPTSTSPLQPSPSS